MLVSSQHDDKWMAKGQFRLQNDHIPQKNWGEFQNNTFLRTFERKSFDIEICFISRLKLGHKLLIPKTKKKKKKGSHRLCLGEKRKGKMA